MPERRLRDQVQILCKPLVDLRIVELRPGLPVDLRRTGLKQEYMHPPNLSLDPGLRKLSHKGDSATPSKYPCSYHSGPPATGKRGSHAPGN